MMSLSPGETAVAESRQASQEEEEEEEKERRRAAQLIARFHHYSTLFLPSFLILCLKARSGDGGRVRSIPRPGGAFHLVSTIRRSLWIVNVQELHFKETDNDMTTA